MAKKKKAKKKAKKKTAKKKGRKNRGKQTSLSVTPKMALHQKILMIMDEPSIEKIPVRGKAVDQDGNEIEFTRHNEVVDCFEPLLKKYHLTLIQIQAERDRTNRTVDGIFTYLLTDADTGYSEKIEVLGDGNNGVWACESAMTVAHKYALLSTFCRNWPHIFDKMKAEQIMKMASQVFAGVDDIHEFLTEARKASKTMLEMKEFFEKNIKKH